MRVSDGEKFGTYIYFNTFTNKPCETTSDIPAEHRKYYTCTHFMLEATIIYLSATRQVRKFNVTYINSLLTLLNFLTLYRVALCT